MEMKSNYRNIENNCKWSIKSKNSLNDPHIHSKQIPRKKIYENILETIGNSPMVRLNKIPKSEGIKCEIVAKCEFILPGGSCKDRIAKRMFEDAEKQGFIRPGDTIIEPTSGNTGIGLAMVAAVKGYNTIITMPDKMSQEKSDCLNALGAIVLRTPTEAAYNHPNSHFSVAIKLNENIPDSVILDQYNNPSNSLVHYDETAEEIWDQCDGKIDYLVVGVGTGGTITGVGRKLKEKNPNIKIIGVDPHGSILAYPDEMNSQGVKTYQVEGIGYDFIPRNLDRIGTVDKWIKTNDKESFLMARRIIKEEGLMVGGSCGSAMVGALNVAKDLPEDKRVVVIFVDGIRNYISKFLNDDWMLENGYIDMDQYERLQQTSDKSETFGENFKIKEINLPRITPIRGVKTKIREILYEFILQKTECLPVFDENENLIGVIEMQNITKALSSFKLTKDEPIEHIINNSYKRLTINDKIKYLSKAFTRHKHVLVNDDENNFYVCQSKDVIKFFLKIHNTNKSEIKIDLN